MENNFEIYPESLEKTVNDGSSYLSLIDVTDLVRKKLTHYSETPVTGSVLGTPAKSLHIPDVNDPIYVGSYMGYATHALISTSNLYAEYYTEIDTLINFKYSLKKSIPVKIIFENNEVIGSIDEFGLYSFGDNPFEVLRELNEDLTELFEELTELTDEQLGLKPRKWKLIIQKYIKKT